MVLLMTLPVSGTRARVILFRSVVSIKRIIEKLLIPPPKADLPLAR